MAEIRALNKSIRNFYAEKRRIRVRSFETNAKGSIWKAVRMVKDLNPNTISSNLTVGGLNVDPRGIAGAFASYFSTKIKTNVSRARVDANGVYNGKCKLIVQNRHIMTENDVKSCLGEQKTKNVRVLIESHYV